MKLPRRSRSISRTATSGASKTQRWILASALAWAGCSAAPVVPPPGDAKPVGPAGEPGPADDESGGDGDADADSNGDDATGYVPADEDDGTCGQAPEAVPTDLLPVCTAQTRQCVADCGRAAEDAEACEEDCLIRDAAAPVGGPDEAIDCETCVWAQITACADRDGCHEALAAAVCCEEQQRCGDEASCDAGCAAEAEAWETCLFDVAPHCLDLLAADAVACFADDGGAS